MNMKICFFMLLFMSPFTSLTEEDLREEYEDCRDEHMKSYSEVTD